MYLTKNANTVSPFDLPIHLMKFLWIECKVFIHACTAHAYVIPIILCGNQTNLTSKLAPYISRDQRDSSSRILLTWCKKKNNSGCQAARIEASVSLRLLTHVILNVEFRLIRVVAFSGLQIPETRVADQLF